jgi:hypothetical protein
MVAFKFVLAALLSALVATAMPLPFPQSDDSVSTPSGPAAAANTPVTGSGPIAGDSSDESTDQTDSFNGDGGSALWKKKRQTGPIAGDSSDDESTDQTDAIEGDGSSALWKKKRQTDDDDTTIDVGPIAGDSSDTNIVEADLFAAGSEDFWKRKE